MREPVPPVVSGGVDRAGERGVRCMAEFYMSNVHVLPEVALQPKDKNRLFDVFYEVNTVFSSFLVPFSFLKKKKVHVPTCTSRTSHVARADVRPFFVNPVPRAARVSCAGYSHVTARGRRLSTARRPFTSTLGS